MENEAGNQIEPTQMDLEQQPLLPQTTDNTPPSTRLYLWIPIVELVSGAISLTIVLIWTFHNDLLYTEPLSVVGGCIGSIYLLTGCIGVVTVEKQTMRWLLGYIMLESIGLIATFVIISLDVTSYFINARPSDSKEAFAITTILTIIGIGQLCLTIASWIAIAKVLTAKTKHPTMGSQEKYTIDSSQNQFAFIFYNTHHRNGAEEEATDLHNSLNDIGFTSTLTEWEDIGCLPTSLNQKVCAISSTASLVMVCIMAHGKFGNLSDSQGIQIPLNFILCQLSQVIPEETPLVVVVQACQNFANLPVYYEESADMAQPATADNHVLLVRQHTVLLMATVAGGTAKRGLYTGALAAELRKADGTIGIRTMHTNAAMELRKSGHQQVPELRDTLMKELILQRGAN